MLSTLFPLFLSIILYRLNPIKLDDYYESKEVWLRNLNPTKSRKVPSKFLWLFLSVLIPSSVAIAYLQNYLFELDHLTDATIFFVNRANDNPLYSLIIGLFMGACISSIIICHLFLRKGKEFVKELLLLKWGGTYVYNNIRTSKATTMALGVGLTVLNFWTSNIFLEISESEIKYSTWLMPYSESRPVNEIECINQYKKRIAPIGTEKVNSTLEIIYYDNSALDTFYLIERYHFKAVKQAIQSATNSEIPIFYVNIPKRNGMIGNCE